MSQVEADAGSAHELSEQPVGFHATFPEIKTNSEMNLVATSLSVQPSDKEDKPDGEMEPSDAISNTEDTPNGEVQSSDPSDVVMETSDVIPNNGNHGASDTAEDEVETTGISFEGMQLHEPDNTYVEKEIPQNSEQEDTSEGVNEHDGLSNGVHASDTMSLAALLENDRIRDLEILKSTSEDSRYSSSLESVHSSNLEETVLGRSLNKPKVEITDTNRNQSYSHQSPSRVSIAEDVLGSIASNEEEGRSRQRILSLAAKRYANAVERNPDDFDALYNWALVLQESADSMGTDCSPSDKDGMLEEACKKYEAATNLCPTLHEAFYNWGIAISDRAKIRGRTKEAENLWKQACEKYERSVQLNWASPQALNNWGLALQELGAIVPLKEKRAIVRTAIKKFRAAIHLRFDFHRAIYNLGTVLYGLAEDTLRSGHRIGVKEEAASDLYSQSAVYIASAHSLKPEYPVYRSALRLVRSMLPLPYLKVGYLTVPPKGDSLAPHCDWKRLWFVLDHESLYECEKSNLKSSSINTEHSSLAAMRESELRIEMHDVSFISPCADLSLPAGGGFCIETSSGQYYMVVDSWEAVDSWVDALRLVYTICVRGKSDALAGVLAG